MSLLNLFIPSLGKKLRIVQNGHKSLRGISLPVQKITPEIKDLADKMIVTMKENDIPGVGLAAPQVGINLRMIVIDTRPDGKRSRGENSPGEMLLNPQMPMALINPEILSSSAETECVGEGCLSLPGVEGEVTRPKKVVLRATLLSGEQVMVECGGLLARCLQHEIDHLNGILFIDRAPKDQQLEAKPLLDEMAAKEAKLTIDN